MLLDTLNDKQREAVLATEGPLLILAGAGSGKTRVIVYRVAHLLHSGKARPEEILAVTFTNKAAGEMKTRVADLLGNVPVGAWISTFHSLGLRILRVEAERLGYARSFVIYDDDDQMALVKDLLREEGVDDKAFPPRRVLSSISHAKNQMVTPEEFQASGISSGSRTIARLYERYARRLRAANAMDFDDLIVLPLRLLETDEEASRRWSERCRYLLVDEYQDTNHSQYRLIRALARAHGNVCCVGDEDQSIYRFRGADIQNILTFERDFPGTRIIKLEQNYRSSKVILEAASAMVSHNTSRIGKTLWTENDAGEPLDLFCAGDDLEEAHFAAESMARMDRPPEDFAVLYRTNAQSRLFEEALVRRGMPYLIIGGVRFYERKEVKDLIAYLRLLVNPADEVSWKRVVNVPPREIGKGTAALVEELAGTEGLPPAVAARIVLERSLLTPRGERAIRGFLDLLEDLRLEMAEKEPGDFLSDLIQRIGYREFLERDNPQDAESRLENVDELVAAVGEYAGGVEGIQQFLERTALLSEVENTRGAGGVSLMTLHCAKGLEFPVVFLVGMEENLFPHAHSREELDDVEEERRLCYVGMTRAKERLLLTRAVSRRLFGRSQFNEPSRFLEEIPPHLLRDLTRRAVALPRPRVAESSRSYVLDPEAGEFREREGAGPYKLGKRVHHPEYGIGTIIGVEGAGESLKLTVSFSVYGSKKFLPRYSQLEPI
ncbi:MAG: UvrD-helicase domain-containing protein [Acidobacteria bacterium]|nr:UvrD-helicase domain-containing protein [Acidobacteriota bacterium]